MNEDFDFDEELENQESPNGRKEITLNDHQRIKIKETLKRMDDNLVKPQITVGRVFVGAGFASNPEKIIFRDFEVGIPMHVTIELTNISYGFNSFKLLPLNDEIIDFIEIDFNPCGRIPAGISTKMTLKFTPVVEKDLKSSLNLLSETGLVEIPLESFSKKCEVQISNSTIDFGEVILGNQVERQLNLENTGALSCIYTFLDNDKNLFYYASENENTNLTENSENVKLYEDFVERSLIVEKNNFLEDSKNIKIYFLKQVNYNSKGSIEGYSKKTINFILDSKFIGEYSLKLFFRIEYKKSVEYKPIYIKFNVIDLPVNSEEKIYHLDYLIEENTFREKLILSNKSNIPYKVQIYNPKDVNEFLELNPNLGYIQANSSFEIWIKLKINKKIRSLPKFYKGKDQKDEFNFPLKILIHNINVPLIVILNFFVTTDTIELNKLFLNFDKTFTDEANKLSLSIQNKSLLPQKYGFIMLPKELSVKNNIDTILSDEKLNVDVIYESQDNYLGHREGDIFCKVITNDLTVQNVKLKFHVELQRPDIILKPKHILFPVLPEREKANLIINLKNSSTDDFICEWLTPPNTLSGLVIMPKVFEINSGKIITCIIEYESNFRPHGPFSFEEIQKEIIEIYGKEAINDSEIEANNGDKTELKNPLMEDKLKQEIEYILNGNNTIDKDKGKKSAEQKQPKKDEKKVDKKDKKQLEEEEKKLKEIQDKLVQEEEEKRAKRVQEFDIKKELKLFGCERYSFEEERKSEHSKFIIPLYYKVNLRENEDEDGIQTKKNQMIKMTFIEVSSTTIEKDLLFDKEEIDFGEVSVKTRKTINVTLTNKSNKIAQIKMKPLIVSNCFQVINAVRDIAPGGVFNYLIDFYPLKDLPYFDEFTVYTDETQSTIKLKGIGVQPEIEILGIENNVLFLGNSMVYNYLEKSFEIQNKSNFAIDYEVRVLKSGKKNKNGYKPFTFVPYKGSIPAMGKIPVKITFFGDHQDFLNFFELILVDVPNQKKPNRIFVQAACWQRQTYWRELITPTFPDEKFFKINTEQEYFTDPLKINKSNNTNMNPNSNDKILLEFLKYSSENLSKEDIEKTTKRKISIGNCRLNDPKNEKAGAFEIIMPKEDTFFSVDNPKGTVNAGSEVAITVTLKRPGRDPLLKDLNCLNDIGMWITTKAELKLSGGFVNPGAIDSVSVDILLRAYIEQI